MLTTIHKSSAEFVDVGKIKNSQAKIEINKSVYIINSSHNHKGQYLHENK